MKRTSAFRVWESLTLFCFIMLTFGSCRKFDRPAALRHFEQVNLVDNNGEYNAQRQDTALLNAWGIAFNPTGVAWVNSQAGHVSEIYDKEGLMLRPPVYVPSPGGPTGGNPTGIVFYGGDDFKLSNGQAARFIFVGVDGVVSGWNPGAGDTALLIGNNSSTSAYTGLTMAKKDDQDYLYAADFRAGKIEVWDKEFVSVPMNFVDPGIPAGFAPFNIQAVGDWLYVTYAKVGATGEDEPAPGLGYVTIFSTGGELVKRFASQGALNAPWGVAHAPAGFFNDSEEMAADDKTGHHDHKDRILIGNFGDGRINAYTADGEFVGPLTSRNKPIVIEGLWAIVFPPSTATTVDPDRLYFAAGPDDEKDGLFGYIIKK